MYPASEDERARRPDPTTYDLVAHSLESLLGSTRQHSDLSLALPIETSRTQLDPLTPRGKGARYARACLFVSSISSERDPRPSRADVMLSGMTNYTDQMTGIDAEAHDVALAMLNGNRAQARTAIINHARPDVFALKVVRNLWHLEGSGDVNALCDALLNVQSLLDVVHARIVIDDDGLARPERYEPEDLGADAERNMSREWRS